jgi:hypothetical protein
MPRQGQDNIGMGIAHVLREKHILSPLPLPFRQRPKWEGERGVVYIKFPAALPQAMIYLPFRQLMRSNNRILDTLAWMSTGNLNKFIVF